MTGWSALVRAALAVAVLIAALGTVLFALAFMNASGESAAQNVSDEIAALERDVLDEYDGAVVRGTTVLSAVEYFAYEQMAVIVRVRNGNVLTFGTGLSSPALYRDGERVLSDAALDTDVQVSWNSDTTDTESGEWINPSATYRTAVVYGSESGAVIGVYLEQVGASGGIL